MKKILLIIAFGFFILPHTSFAAIALDASWGRANGSGVSVSLPSVAPAGANRMLICTIQVDNVSVTGVPSFGGTSFTQLGNYLDSINGDRSYSNWYLIAPTTVSGSVTATLSGAGGAWNIGCDSYTGVAQALTFGTPIQGTGAIGTPVSIQRTSSTTGSWMWLGFKEDSASVGLSITAGGIIRDTVVLSSFGGGTIVTGQFDSNTTVNSGNTQTMTIAWTGGAQSAAYTAAMFAPSVPDAITTAKDQFFGKIIFRGKIFFP